MTPSTPQQGDQNSQQGQSQDPQVPSTTKTPSNGSITPPVSSPNTELPSFSFDDSEFTGSGQETEQKVTESSQPSSGVSEELEKQATDSSSGQQQDPQEQDPFMGGVASTNITLDDLVVPQKEQQTENLTSSAEKTPQGSAGANSSAIIDPFAPTAVEGETSSTSESSQLPSFDTTPTPQAAASIDGIDIDFTEAAQEKEDTPLPSFDLPGGDISQSMGPTSSTDTPETSHSDQLQGANSEANSSPNESQLAEESGNSNESSTLEATLSTDGEAQDGSTNTLPSQESQENKISDSGTEDIMHDTLEEDDTYHSQQEEQEVNTGGGYEVYEDFTAFNQALSDYLDYRNSESVSVVGLRTDDEEVNYEFTMDTDDEITVIKSTTGDVLSFIDGGDNLEVILNNESIAHYGYDEVADDITHYLKEKFGKFTILLKSEFEKETKAEKERLKAIKTTLKNF